MGRFGHPSRLPGPGPGGKGLGLERYGTVKSGRVLSLAAQTGPGRSVPTGNLKEHRRGAGVTESLGPTGVTDLIPLRARAVTAAALNLNGTRRAEASLSLGVTVNYCSAVQALKLAKPSGAGGPQRPSEAFSSLRRGRVAESEPGNLKKTQPSLVCVQFIWPGFSLSTTSEWDASSLTARLPYVIRSISCQ